MSAKPAQARDSVAQRAVDDAGAPLTQAVLFMAAAGLQSLAPQGPLTKEIEPQF